MLWIKAFHIVAMVSWFAGIFYLPRLFVYHTQVSDAENNQRFKTMERKLYFAIMTPAMLVTVALGVWLIVEYGMAWFKASYWLHAKLALVALLLVYHFYLGACLKRFASDANKKSEKFYRLINELPVVILIAVVILAEVKPF